MAGKQKDTGIHVQEACDTWLSTENRHKVTPKPCHKQARKRTSTPRVFKPLNTSLLEFNFTQTKSVVATKQTNITAFFTGRNPPGDPEADCDVISVSSNSIDTEESELPHYISLEPRLSKNDDIQRKYGSSNCKENIRNDKNFDRLDNHHDQKCDHPANCEKDDIFHKDKSPKMHLNSEGVISLNSDLSCDSVLALSPVKAGKTTSCGLNQRRNRLYESNSHSEGHSQLGSRTVVSPHKTAKLRNESSKFNCNNRGSMSFDKEFHTDGSALLSLGQDSKSSSNMTGKEDVFQNNASFTINTDLENNNFDNVKKSSKISSDNNEKNQKLKDIEDTSQFLNMSFTINTDLENMDRHQVNNGRDSNKKNQKLKDIQHTSEVLNMSFTINTDLENIDKANNGRDSNEKNQKLKNKNIFESDDLDTVFDFSEGNNSRKSASTSGQANGSGRVKYVVEEEEITDSFWSLGSLDSCKRNSDSQDSLKENDVSRESFVENSEKIDGKSAIHSKNNSCHDRKGKMNKLNLDNRVAEKYCENMTNQISVSLNIEKRKRTGLNDGNLEETVLKRRLKSAYYGSGNKRKRATFSEITAFDTEFDNCDNRKRYRVNKAGIEKSEAITDSYFTLTD